MRATTPLPTASTGPALLFSPPQTPEDRAPRPLVELRFRAPDEPARPVVVATPASRPPMTVADERFVGEPVAPATPVRHLTQFDRLVAQYSNLPLDAALGLATTSPEPSAEQPAAPPPPPRAATLGESRRRGLTGYRKPREPEPERDDPEEQDDERPPPATPHSCPDLGDTNTLDDLAGRLYRHVRTRLRTELLVDRERSGLLADPM
ncbi:hypothetical protein [Actinophytocola sp. KF-1]